MDQGAGCKDVGSEPRDLLPALLWAPMRDVSRGLPLGRRLGRQDRELGCAVPQDATRAKVSVDLILGVQIDQFPCQGEGERQEQVRGQGGISTQLLD